MIHKVELPQLGESVTEGEIGKWLVAEGDEIRKYDPIVEVITDKVNIEMPSPVSGVLLRIVASEGETLPMGAVIAEIEAEDEALSDVPPSPADTLGTLTHGVAVGPTGAANVPQMDSASDISVASEAASTRPAPTAPIKAGPSGGTTRLSPAVRKIAERYGVDTSLITGTGMGGRVTRRDIERYVAQMQAGQERVCREDRQVTPSPVRRMIAENMARSTAEIPHAWGMVEVDASGMVDLRRVEKERFEEFERPSADLLGVCCLGGRRGPEVPSLPQRHLDRKGAHPQGANQHWESRLLPLTD